MEQKKTIRDYLEDLANRTTSTVDDEKLVEYVLFKIGIEGRCTGGIVYIFPYDKQPVDVHTFAKFILKGLKQ